MIRLLRTAPPIIHCCPLLAVTGTEGMKAWTHDEWLRNCPHGFCLFTWFLFVHVVPVCSRGSCLAPLKQNVSVRKTLIILMKDEINSCRFDKSSAVTLNVIETGSWPLGDLWPGENLAVWLAEQTDLQTGEDGASGGRGASVAEGLGAARTLR